MNRTPLTPDRAQREASRDFDEAMDAVGGSDEVVGEYLCVSAKVVWNLRHGVRALTLGRVYQLPPRLREEVLRRAAARHAPAEIPGDPTPEGQAFVCDGALGEWLCAKARSMADKVWTPEEARRDLPILRRTIEALRGLEKRLEATAGRGEWPS